MDDNLQREKKMRILVTGAGGMVGSHMVEKLYAEGHNVLGTYYKPTTDISELPKDIRMLECDVRYYQSLLRIVSEFRPDRIFHLAAQSYPTVSWNHPQATIDTNVNGTINLFESVKVIRNNVPDYDPIIVVACSSAEYGQTLNELEDPFVKEDAELKPLHPYGVSKVGQDLLAYQYFMNDHIRTIRVRIFNSTGTRKVCDVTSDFTKRAVLAERDGSYVLTVGNLETRRAIMDQRDLVRGLILLSEKGRVGEVYNLSSEKCYQMKDIVAMIEEYVGHPYKTVVDTKLLRPTDERIIIGNIDKLKRDTGWAQEIDMRQTVADMIEYWRKVL